MIVPPSSVVVAMNDPPDHDLIVVGAGTAGMPCAIVAAESGARVLVLEKSGEIGGTLHISAGQMSAAGSRLQREKGIDDSPQEHFDEVMQLGHGRNDPTLVRLAVDEAAATLDWLQDLGLEFPSRMPIVYYGHEPYSKPRTAWGREMGISILAVLRARFEQLVDEGRIELLLECRLERLLTEAGAVVGVLATGPNGPAEHRGAAVALCCGGYAAGREVFDELHPGVHCVLGGRETSTGDGLRAARDVGAALRGAECHLGTIGTIETAPGSGRMEFWEAFANLAPQFRGAREIWVNQAAQRFIAEDCPSADERERALHAEGGRFWIVFDESAIDEDDPLVLGWSSEMLREKAAGGALVCVADTIGELAEKAGLDPAGLHATTDAFNTAVRDGVDPLGRAHLENGISRAPFYALAAHAGTTVSFAGVHVDAELRALDDAGQPIPGLFAAGEVIGAASLMGDGYSGGMCVTPALSFGRVLGAQLGRS